ETNLKGGNVTLKGSTLRNVVYFARPVDTRFSFKLDEARQPRFFDLLAPAAQGQSAAVAALGLYSLTDKELTVLLSDPRKSRPTELKTAPKTTQFLLVLRRDPQAKWEPLPKEKPRPRE